MISRFFANYIPLLAIPLLMNLQCFLVPRESRGQEVMVIANGTRGSVTFQAMTVTTLRARILLVSISVRLN